MSSSSGLDSTGWEEIGKKSKNKNKASASTQWSSLHSSPKAWGHSDTVQKLGLRSSDGYGKGSCQTGPALSSDHRKSSGRGFNKPQTYSDFVAAPPVIPPPLKNGWGWSNRPGSSQAPKVDEVDDDVIDEDSDGGNEDSDDELLSDDFDSDEGEKSHEDRKNNKWFKEFFQSLDSLTIEQINEPERQWHCPACKGGPGAIDWYCLQPLITHARTKKSKRMKLHRELSLVLDEELRLRGTSAVPAGEIYGKWQGLKERADKQIVWPPMVVIMNTKLEKDENDKWKGMGNQELLDCFSGYNAVRARHSYGPQGHRGVSVLIFEASAVGYAEAERLSKSFEDNFKGRNDWDRNRALFYSGGQRQLYGFMAEKQDLENFNQHSQGKSKLKYDMCSYHEMVVKQLKQMSEDNQQLLYFKNKVATEQTSKIALEQSLDKLSEKLRRTMVDNRAVKQATKKHFQQNREEMDSQDQFYKDQFQQLHDARIEKEEKFQEGQLNVREEVTKAEAKESSAEERPRRSEEIEKFIQLQDKRVGEFLGKREALVERSNKMMEEMEKQLQQQMQELKRQHFEKEMALEKLFDQELNQLMEEYAPSKSN
ncbi:hypothetical protein ACS0TY_031357 [Phlomoides rotata]